MNSSKAETLPPNPSRRVVNHVELLARIDAKKGRPADYREKKNAEVAEWAKTQPNGGVGVNPTVIGARR